MAPTNLIVIIGGSGTGKTTLARALQERLLPEQWFHFSPDTLLYCLPKTIVDQADLANNWSAVDVELITRLAYSCVDEALRSGARVLFDCVVMTERRARQLTAVFATSDPFLVGTTCDWDELVRRTAGRGDRTLEEVRRGFETGGQFLDPDCVLDTTACSPTGLVDELLKHMKYRGGASAWRRNLERYSARG
jgi:chloramphenicol 3-O phosphotransferase